MSQKIPFLEMFAALNQWQEFVNAMEGWLIVEAAIDRKTRSAVVTVEGAGGAGPNLIAQAEEAVARCYGLNSVKLKPITEEKAKAVEPEVPQPAPAPHHRGRNRIYRNREAHRYASEVLSREAVPVLI